MVARILSVIFVFTWTGASLAQSSHSHHEHQVGQGETYICPMHPQITQDEPGTCPICGMDLVVREEEEEPEPPGNGHHHQSDQGAYTCPMHPNITQDEPGTCPICGMDLVARAIEESAPSGSEESIRIRLATRRLAGIKTETVQAGAAVQSIEASGTITFDEGRTATIAPYVAGRIEKLYANYLGVKVERGEHLAEFYSPNLYSAQTEYLQAEAALRAMQGGRTKASQKAMLRGAERKLAELGMSTDQIQALKRSRKAQSRLTLNATASGVVTAMTAREGLQVKAGQAIFQVADLSTVWLLLDLYPEETAFLRFGLKVEARARSAPGKTFPGRISFISPVVDPKTRTVRVRVEIPNPNGRLRPGDLAEAEIAAPVSASDSKIYDPDLAGKYVSPMHPQEIRNKPGNCPVCGMELIPASEFGYLAADSGPDQVLSVPRDALLSIGGKHAVFVEGKSDRFSLREVTTGPAIAENRIVILEGLTAGETIASEGVFLVDSQMQLSGKTSLLQRSMDAKKDAAP